METTKCKSVSQQNFSSFIFDYYKELSNILIYLPDDLLRFIIEFFPNFLLDKPTFLDQYQTNSHMTISNSLFYNHLYVNIGSNYWCNDKKLTGVPFEEFPNEVFMDNGKFIQCYKMDVNLHMLEIYDPFSTNQFIKTKKVLIQTPNWNLYSDTSSVSYVDSIYLDSFYLYVVTGRGIFFYDVKNNYELIYILSDKPKGYVVQVAIDYHGDHFYLYKNGKISVFHKTSLVKPCYEWKPFGEYRRKWLSSAEKIYIYTDYLYVFSRKKLNVVPIFAKHANERLQTFDLRTEPILSTCRFWENAAFSISILQLLIHCLPHPNLLKKFVNFL